MINLSQKEIDDAKAYMKCLFISGPSKDRPASIPYNSRFDSFYEADCAPIIKELIERQGNFVRDRLDSRIANIAGRKFRNLSGNKISRSDDQVIRYLVWFCQTAKLFWNGGIWTPQELDEILKTKFGKALYDAGCFLNVPASQQSPTSTAQTTATSTTTKQPSSRTPGQPPANAYKTTGGHSQDIPNLIGPPNQKLHPACTAMFCIEADKIGKNVPCAFITPLKTVPGGVKQVHISDATKVNFGSGNGYTDCALWFDNINDANAALAYCQGQTNITSKYSNLRVAQAKTDPNGYFQVGTNLGPAYIKAKKLNEDLDEALGVNKPYENSSKNFKITDVDLYAEWMHKSYS